MVDSPQSNLRKQAVKGIGWSIVARFGQQILRFTLSVILARLLSPHDYGLIGMIHVFSGFITTYTDMGFGSALVQKQDPKPDHYSSVFWLNVAAGLVLMLLFMAISPLLAWFYDEPLLTPLNIFISTSFFIGSFKVVQISLLQRHMDFKRLAIVDLAAYALAGVIAIGMAFYGFGVWSLAWFTVIEITLTVILLWNLNNWRPARRFNWAAVKELLAYSTNSLGFDTTMYWLRNGDNLLIGRFLGASPLGIYTKSYTTMLLPLRLVSTTIGRVMFPALSSIQDDKQRVATVYLRMTRTIALVTFPMMIGLWVLSDHFVLAFFGGTWTGMIPILSVFCWTGLLQSITILNGNLYRSQGRTDLQFKVEGLTNALGIGAIIIGLNWGVEGVANAYTIFVVLATYPTMQIAVSLVGLTFLQVAKKLAPVFGCASGMGVMIWLLETRLPANWSHWAYLAIGALLGGVIYFLLLYLFKVQAYQDTQSLLLEQWKLRRYRSKLVRGSASSS